jgi:hypothetical protein
MGEVGLSLFEYKSAAERDLILASVACIRRSDDPIDFLAIAEEVVALFGAVVSTTGETPLPLVNGWHRELQWRSPELDRLATKLLELGKTGERVRRPALRALLMNLPSAEIDTKQADTLQWLTELKGRATAR